MRALLLITCMLFCTSAWSARAVKLSDAVDAYKTGRFSKAIDLFQAFLAAIPAADKGSTSEREAREKLVLSLYASKKRDAALTEYKILRRQFPDFFFDADRVSPDTVEFFASVPTGEPRPEPPASDAVVVAQPETPPDPTLQPRVIEPAPAKQWHWYYLAPLGVGQYLAGSPVRGTILLILEVGFITMNAVCFALLMPQIRTDGSVQSIERALPLQVLTNVGFFGWISSLVYGVMDGIFLEP